MQVTGFTNAEEKAVGLTDVVPFLLECALLVPGSASASDLRLRWLSQELGAVCRYQPRAHRFLNSSHHLAGTRSRPTAVTCRARETGRRMQSPMATSSRARTRSRRGKSRASSSRRWRERQAVPACVGGVGLWIALSCARCVQEDCLRLPVSVLFVGPHSSELGSLSAALQTAQHDTTRAISSGPVAFRCAYGRSRDRCGSSSRCTDAEAQQSALSVARIATACKLRRAALQMKVSAQERERGCKRGQSCCGEGRTVSSPNPTQRCHVYEYVYVYCKGSRR